MLVIDPEECIDCGACEPECPVEAIFPEDALPEKWEPFVKINYAFDDGMDVINQLVDEYATEHNVQNPPLDQQQRRADVLVPRRRPRRAPVRRLFRAPTSSRRSIWATASASTGRSPSSARRPR